MNDNMNIVSLDNSRICWILLLSALLLITMPTSKSEIHERRRNRQLVLESRPKSGKVTKRKRKDSVVNKTIQNQSPLLQMTADNIVVMHDAKENGENIINMAPVGITDGISLPRAEDLPPLQSPVKAGFQDCTLETIKYLTLVEQMPEDHPVILGLRRHLRRQENRLEDSRVVDEDSTRAHEVETCTFFSNNIHPSARISREPVPKSTQNLNENLNSNKKLDELKKDMDIADMLPSLALLGQCNPAIGRLTNELNDLLQNIGDSDSD